MLTSEEVEMIVLDIVRGVPLRVFGTDADEFSEQFAADIRLANENGWTIELPFEIPDVSSEVVVKEDTPIEDSVIVAFNVEGNEDVLKLQESLVPEEYRIKDLHITLLYVGHTDELDKDKLSQAVSEIASISSPIHGVFNGFAYFDQKEDSGEVAVVLLFDSPTLNGFQHMLKMAIQSPERSAPDDHGFTAHVTLGYIPRNIVDIPADYIHYPVSFDSVYVYWGGEHTEFPLSGDVVYKQLPVDEASKANLIEIRRSMFVDEVDSLAERMYVGEISIGQWEEQMRGLIRELHASVAAIGKGGWDQMTPADWGRIGPVVKEQYRYLHAFAEKIATDRDTISLEAIKARAHMYGNAGEFSSVVVQAGDVFAKKLPWLPKDGSSECFFWPDKVRVFTEEKGFVRLASVNIGDRVLTHTGKFKDVLENNSFYVRDVNSVELDIAVDNRVSKLCTTPDHLFLSSDGQWIRADNLSVGDRLVRVGKKCKRDGCNNVVRIANRKNKEYCSVGCASIGARKFERAHDKHRQLAIEGNQILQRLHRDPDWQEYYRNVSKMSIAKIHADRVGKTYEDLHGEEKSVQIREKLSKARKGRDWLSLYGEEKANREYNQYSDAVVMKVNRVVRSGTVGCLVVEDDESFAITNGLISHNCLVNCRCFWELRIVDTLKKGTQKYNYVQATYNNRPAEHCKTCIERNGKVFMIEVHESVPVPETIG